MARRSTVTTVPEASAKTKGRTLARLKELLEERQGKPPVDDFGSFERELRGRMAEIERDLLAEELQRFDIDAPVVLIDGVPHRRVLRCEETYMSAAGPVRVERTLYSTRRDGERAVSALELRAGIVEKHWTPLAAEQAVFMVSLMTPQETATLCAKLGQMQPSKSSLDRLPKQLSREWEAKREAFEQQLRADDLVPAEAATVAVSLDGVLVPMRDGEREEKRARATAEGRPASGPAGYQEVGCGTVSFYDATGERLSTVKFGRMPEFKKSTLKRILAQELGVALAQRPDLTLVTVADGANDNWNFLHGALPPSTEVIDFYHAADHLNVALSAAYGDGTVKCRAQFDKLRRVLLEDPDGVEKIIRSLLHLTKQHPGSGRLANELAYFRKHRHRMRYATWQAACLPIGSGVVEAACKTLATQRMKRSGMRWRHEGGQAILTFRSLVQSDRFDRAWALLAATYRAEVTLMENVVALSDYRK
ncbi:uncharacterized protein SOCEGT47_017060 [Sorangium cellulosum]|uniref:ISKra4 family transposase n=1 Tax=Sorangium cellulosum TaxID=56 RepID=A0A4P2PXF5_SORCE|nr:uncharacterized protein SOCEGT47_017060 [Sorangium cellulosum]